MQRPLQIRPRNGLFQGQDKSGKPCKIICWNAGGLTDVKFLEIKKIIIDKDIDLFAILEAGKSTENLQIYQIPGYAITALNRARQVASGILVGVKIKHTVKFQIMHKMSASDKHEAVRVKLLNENLRLNTYFIYNPPTNKCDLSWLEKEWDNKTLVMGDLNAHSQRWGYAASDPVGKVIEDFMDNGPVEYIENEGSDPTFLAHSGLQYHPDLVFSHTSLRRTLTHTLLPPPCATGHSILSIEIGGSRRLFKKVREPRFPRWNFKKARWSEFSVKCDEEFSSFSFNDSIDYVYKQIVNKIIKCAAKCIPRGQVKRYTPFWTEELEQLKIERDEARRAAQISGCPLDCIRLRQKNGILKRRIKATKRETYRKFLADLDFRKDGIRAYNYISKINQNPAGISEPMVSGQKILTQLDIANKFCQNFAKVSNFKVKRKRSQLTIHGCPNEEDYHIANDSFTTEELQRALRNIKTGKSPGVDGIHSEFLLHLGPLTKGIILRFINLTWETGYVPDLWRKSQVIPILKNDKPCNDFESYRPVSLTSIFCKLAEKMVLERLKGLLDRKNGISFRQAGFRKHRSTTEQIARFSQNVKDGFHKKQSTLAIFVDFKAAFDRVWRDKLLYKLKTLEINGNLLAWIKSFLSQRHMNVKFKESLSRFKQIKQGLPQGSVISPTLFNVMINDIIDGLMHELPGTEALLYADDLIIWATSSNIRSLENWANQALMILNKWSEENEMIINPQKSTYQLFTLSTKNYQLNINLQNHPIPRTNEAKYLGLLLDNKLNWNKQIESMVEKGESRLRLLKRLTAIKWGANSGVLVTAYKSYIRPVLEYGSEVLVTASTSTLTRLDLVQNKALRIITGAAKTTPIAAMQLQTGIEPLAVRREKNAVQLYERMVRMPDGYWANYKLASQRLKTQESLASKVKMLTNTVGLSLENREDLIVMESYDRWTPPRLEIELISSVNKSTTPKYELKVLALTTIAERFPTPEWAHLYTDGSATGACRDGGAGVYSTLFQLSCAVGKYATNFDGEVAAIQLALEKISEFDCRRVVVLSDSMGALIAIGSSEPSDNRAISACRKLIFALVQDGREVALQWIPAHCGIFGNEQADQLARAGAAQTQPQVPLPYASAKRIISASFKLKHRHEMERTCEGKRWAILLDPSQRLPNTLPRAIAVAGFRLLTGHDYLQQHLKRIGVADSPLCPLCHSENMNAEHLLRCSELQDTDCDNLDNSLNNMAKLYWAARRKMAEMPGRTGVG